MSFEQSCAYELMLLCFGQKKNSSNYNASEVSEEKKSGNFSMNTGIQVGDRDLLDLLSYLMWAKLCPSFPFLQISLILFCFFPFICAFSSHLRIVLQVLLIKLLLMLCKDLFNNTGRADWTGLLFQTMGSILFSCTFIQADFLYRPFTAFWDSAVGAQKVSGIFYRYFLISTGTIFTFGFFCSFPFLDQLKDLW